MPTWGSILTLVARPSGFVAIVRPSDDSLVAKGSADGYTWTQLSTLPTIRDFCNWDMLTCTRGAMSEGLVYSSDGVSWQLVPWPAGLPSGGFDLGPSPDPIFMSVFVGDGSGWDSAVYVIQRQP